MAIGWRSNFMHLRDICINLHLNIKQDIFSRPLVRHQYAALARIFGFLALFYCIYISLGENWPRKCGQEEPGARTKARKARCPMVMEMIPAVVLTPGFTPAPNVVPGRMPSGWSVLGPLLDQVFPGEAPGVSILNEANPANSPGGLGLKPRKQALTVTPGAPLDLAGLAEKAMVDEADLASALGVHRRTIPRMVARGELPPGMRLGGRLVWIVGNVRAWLAKRAAALEKKAEIQAAKYPLRGAWRARPGRIEG